MTKTFTEINEQIEIQIEILAKLFKQLEEKIAKQSLDILDLVLPNISRDNFTKITQNKFDAFSKNIGKLVSYKDKNYILKYIGFTKYGPRAKLSWVDDSFSFWVNISDLELPVAKFTKPIDHSSYDDGDCVPPWEDIPMEEF